MLSEILQQSSLPSTKSAVVIGHTVLYVTVRNIHLSFTTTTIIRDEKARNFRNSNDSCVIVCT